MSKSIGWSVLSFFICIQCALTSSLPALAKVSVGELAQFSSRPIPEPGDFRSGVYCCRYDFSDFLFVFSLVGCIRSSWVGSDENSALVFECGLDIFVHCPESIPFPLTLLVAPTLLVSILHGTLF